MLPSPSLTSARLGWRGYILELHRVNTFETRDVVWLNHVVILQMRSAITVERKEGSGYVTQRLLPGQISLRPAQLATSARSRDSFEVLTLSLDPMMLETSCIGMLEGRGLHLRRLDGVEDRFVEGICLALRDEVENDGRAGRFYTDTLASSLAVHLASKYGVEPVRTVKEDNHRSRRAIQQAMELIHDRLQENLSLGEIASAAGLSAFHFARMFKANMGVSPYQYLIRQRIERAKTLLMQGGRSIAAVAFETGFSDQSHLTLQFKRLCGITPKQFVDRHAARKIVR